ncbi:hypothetical protein OIU76_015307 [Salix suchowensis]|nr:hypothetical protein OIU76_015307 [Salix suchowensis]
MVHPFFGGTKDDEMWMYMCPTNSGLNDPRMNPGTEDLARLGCERMLIFVAEEDYLTVASKNYYEKLTKSGWKGTVELVENEKEDHCFHLFDLDAEKALEMRHKGMTVWFTKVPDDPCHQKKTRENDSVQAKNRHNRNTE